MFIISSVLVLYRNLIKNGKIHYILRAFITLENRLNFPPSLLVLADASQLLFSRQV